MQWRSVSHFPILTYCESPSAADRETRKRIFVVRLMRTGPSRRASVNPRETPIVNPMNVGARFSQCPRIPRSQRYHLVFQLGDPWVKSLNERRDLPLGKNVGGCVASGSRPTRRPRKGSPARSSEVALESARMRAVLTPLRKVVRVAAGRRGNSGAPRSVFCPDPARTAIYVVWTTIDNPGDVSTGPSRAAGIRVRWR
jgi:hypothetical protein